jgi:hypothetical protein
MVWKISIPFGSDGKPEDREAVARALRDAARTSGFFYITGHGVPQALMEAMFAASKAFHSKPRSFDLPRFRIAPLAPAHVDEDFDAVTGSPRMMKGLFGDWPDGLTREENMIDLAWHEREFTLRRSFSWIARNPEGY